MSEDDKSSGTLLLHKGDEVRLDHGGKQNDPSEDRLRRLMSLDRDLDRADVADRCFVRVLDFGIPRLRRDVVVSSSHEVEQLLAVCFLE